MQKNNKLPTLKAISYKLKANGGFTLIEMLLVVAIISILAGAILVSINSQRQKARQAKMLAELSGTLQPITMCLSDSGDVRTPCGAGAICDINPNYGSWPSFSGNGYTGCSYTNNSTGWSIRVQQSDVSNSYICCNSGSSKCAIRTTTTCGPTTSL